MTSQKRIRVLVAKPGLDGHDKGAKIVCQLLRDAGMEVIYSGLHVTIPAIVKTAIEEDVDVVGLSVLSGSHKEVCAKLLPQLRQAGFQGHVVVGGVIPSADEEFLKASGVAAVFRMDTPYREIVETINALVDGTINNLSAGGATDL